MISSARPFLDYNPPICSLLLALEIVTVRLLNSILCWICAERLRIGTSEGDLLQYTCFAFWLCCTGLFAEEELTHWGHASGSFGRRSVPQCQKVARGPGDEDGVEHGGDEVIVDSEMDGIKVDSGARLQTKDCHRAEAGGHGEGWCCPRASFVLKLTLQFQESRTRPTIKSFKRRCTPLLA